MKPGGSIPAVRFGSRVAALCTALFWLTAVASRGVGAEPLAQRYAAYGDLIVTQMVTAPFPHPQRAEGHRYEGTLYSAVEHYRDSTVAIFVPKDFKPSGTVDFVVHFHGWHNHVDNVLAAYKLIEQFSASGKNAILIVPQGPFDAPDSFGGRLEDADGFKHFMKEAIDILKQHGTIKSERIGNIILSGHSGGYHVISSILSQGGLTAQIKEVYLFDALYGQTEKFVAWFQATKGKLINIYTRDGGTRTETEKLIAALKRDGVDHWSGNEMDATDLRKSRLLFIFTELAHNDVVEKHQSFQAFLQASLLADRK